MVWGSWRLGALALEGDGTVSAYSIHVAPPRGGRGWSVVARWGTTRRYGRRAGVIDEASAWRVYHLVKDALERGFWWTPGALRQAAPAAVPSLQDTLNGFISHRAMRGDAPETQRALVTGLKRFGNWLQRETDDASLRALAGLYGIHGEDALYAYVAWLGRAQPLGEGLATRTVIQYGSIASRFWAWAERRYRGVVPVRPEFEMKAPPPAKISAPTWAQMHAVLRAAEDDSPVYYKAFLLQCFLGLRVGQALRLRWEDVDLERRVLHVRGEIGKTRAEKAGRLIPISDHLVEALAGWGRREGLVVPRERTTKVERASRKVRYAAVYRILEASEVPFEVWSGCSTHFIRKGFMTNLTREGADRGLVELYVGHSVPSGLSESAWSYLDRDSLVEVLRHGVADRIPAIGDRGTDVLSRWQSR